VDGYLSFGWDQLQITVRISWLWEWWKMVLHCGETFNNRLSKWQAVKGI